MGLHRRSTRALISGFFFLCLASHDFFTKQLIINTKIPVLGRHELLENNPLVPESKQKDQNQDNVVDPSSPAVLFYCRSDNGDGMAEIRAVFNSVLSDYKVKDLSGVRQPHQIYGTPSNEYDVVAGVAGWGMGCHAYVYQWLLTQFKGHIVMYTGESFSSSPDISNYHHHVHYFGPVIRPVKETDMVLTYFQTAWWTWFQDSLPVQAMVDPDLRPKYQLNHQEAEEPGRNFAVYAHNNCVEFREIAAWRLSKCGFVHCLGRCCGKALDGNRTNLVSERVGGIRTWMENIKLYAKYKFCLVMEHEHHHESYVTEKLLMAFIGGCIPIYHGPVDLIFDMINPRAMVFYNINNPDPALRLVNVLHHNETMYKQMQQEPIVADGYNTIQKYFSFSVDVGLGKLRHRIRVILGLNGKQKPSQ